MLEDRIHYNFQNKALLKDALTHPSRRQRGKPSGYERLEFLGDRVLGLVVAEMLLEEFPHEQEGAIAKRHTALVQEKALARIALTIGLQQDVKIAGEDGNGFSNAVLADACEALIGAIYLDGGLAPAQKFIQNHWRDLLKENSAPPEDPKNTLQEWAQARGLPLPVYEIVDQKGPAHSPVFTIEVTVQGKPPVRGTGTSRRAAEKEAAQTLLGHLREKP